MTKPNPFFGMCPGDSPVTQARRIHQCFELDKFSIDNLPIDPIKIAVKMGIAVYGRGGKDDPVYPMSGRLVDQTTGTPRIEFNVTEAIIRHRKVVASLLGHFVLGREQTVVLKGPFYASKDPFDVYASQFSTELIMRSEHVREYFFKRVRSLDEMAARFGVSVDAMGYRLYELRLI